MLQALIDEFRKQELQKQLLAATVTWTNTFVTFKRLRNKIGLPTTPQQKLFYGAILGSIKAAGKMLLAWIDRENADTSPVGIKIEDLKACVRELIEDDLMLDSGLFEDSFADLEAKFCVA